MLVELVLCQPKLFGRHVGTLVLGKPGSGDHRSLPDKIQSSRQRLPDHVQRELHAYAPAAPPWFKTGGEMCEGC